MKRIILLAIIGIIGFSISTGIAQTTQKIAHVYTDSVLYRMPEFSALLKRIQEKQKIFKKTIDRDKSDLVEDYDKLMTTLDTSTMPDFWKQEQIDKFKAEQERVNTNEQKYNNILQEQFNAGLDSLTTELMNAIVKYAEEHGYLYILDASMSYSGSQILYASPTANLTDEIMKAMGIDPNSKIIDFTQFMGGEAGVGVPN